MLFSPRNYGTSVQIDVRYAMNSESESFEESSQEKTSSTTIEPSTSSKPNQSRPLVFPAGEIIFIYCARKSELHH